MLQAGFFACGDLNWQVNGVAIAPGNFWLSSTIHEDTIIFSPRLSAARQVQIEEPNVNNAGVHRSDGAEFRQGRILKSQFLSRGGAVTGAGQRFSPASEVWAF
jgi:hypothetical protein